MLDMVKIALRVVTDAFDAEISALIQAAFADLGIAGVTPPDGDPLVTMAVTTYCRLHFGEPDDYERLKRSYDEQKAQLGMATGYTNWGAING